MDFLEGFEWAVPMAFSDAVDQCRFERGDRLYPSPNAYLADWTEAERQMKTWLQVRYPDRTSRSGSAGTDSIFKTNWTSEVGLTLYENGRKIQELSTTQGRVYTLLWHGDLAVLENGDPAPGPPYRTKYVLRHLEQAVKKRRDRFAGRATFVMPYDRVNRSARDKLHRLEEHLSDDLLRSPEFFSPTELGLPKGDRVSPTLAIASFSVDRMDRTDFGDAVKSVLYRPAKDAKVDRFRMAAHGVLV